MRFEWVPPDWQSRSIAAAVAAARHANKVVIFAYDDGTEGSDRGGNDQNVGLQLPGLAGRADLRRRSRQPERRRRAEHRRRRLHAVAREREVGARDVVSGRRGRSRDRRRARRRRDPERQAADHVPRRLGRAPALPDRRPRLQPGGDRDPEQQHGHGRERRQLPALPGRVHEQPGAGPAHVPDGRHAGERHLPGLPLVRRARQGAALPVRARPLVHAVRVLEPDRHAARRQR